MEWSRSPRFLLARIYRFFAVSMKNWKAFEPMGILSFSALCSIDIIANNFCENCQTVRPEPVEGGTEVLPPFDKLRANGSLALIHDNV